MVFFEFEAFTMPGELVYVVGNLDKLGLWELNEGLLLKTSPEKYPVWVSQPNAVTLFRGMDIAGISQGS